MCVSASGRLGEPASPAVSWGEPCTRSRCGCCVAAENGERCTAGAGARSEQRDEHRPPTQSLPP